MSYIVKFCVCISLSLIKLFIFIIMFYTYMAIKELFGIDNSKTDDDLRKEFSEHFFYPNVCQFCTVYEEKTVVKRCNGCHGMQYCSKEHLDLHWKDHKEFCVCLRKITAAADKKYLFQNYTRDLTANLITLVENELKRKLKPCEKQMFIYPRICLVCFESSPGLVKSCENCPYGNFCASHLDNEIHKEYCKIFLDSFIFDQYWIVFKDIPWERFVHPSPRNKKVIELPNNMDEFLKTYVAPYHNLDLEMQEVKGQVSTIFTRALTLIYVLQKLKLTLCSKLRVHVMCKHKSIEENFIEWEIVLHWLPRLTFLKISFIGCEMSPKVFNVHLCKECKGKTLKIEIVDKLYKDYYKKNSKIPDVIVAFNLDDNTRSTWIDSSSLLTNFGSPIVLTALSETELNEGAQDCVQNPNNFSRIETNPFESLRPERYFQYISFSNHCISIYGHVFPKICGVDQPIDPCNKCIDCHLRVVRKEKSKEVHHLEVVKNQLLKMKAGNYKRIIENMKQGQKLFKEDFRNLKEACASCYYDIEARTLKILQEIQFQGDRENYELGNVQDLE